MSTVHKAILAALTFLPLGLSAVPASAATSPAPAEARTAQARHHTYYVFYRTCPQSPWVCYGGFTCPVQAHQAIMALRARGFDAFRR